MNNKIYIIEDDEKFSNDLSKKMKQIARIDAECFNNAESMFIYLSDIEPPDVIILEYKIEARFLGTMSGPEILDELKFRGFHIPVILITPLKWNDFKRAIDSGVIHELVEKSDLALTIISLSVQSLLSRKRLAVAYAKASQKEATKSHLVFLGVVCLILFLGMIIGFVNHTAYTLAGQ